jgi:hypothetical protein
VEGLKYFRIKTVTNRGIKEEITERIKNVGNYYQFVRVIFWKWKVPKKGKIWLFKSYYMPILTYEAETWTWTREDMSRVMAFKKYRREK